MQDNTESPKEWYVLRDLKRANSKTPAYKVLAKEGYEVFTPMETKKINGKPILRPILSDLLFVHSDKASLDIVVNSTPTLQYRYIRGGYRVPMTVPDNQMNDFIKVASTETAQYHIDILPSMIGCPIHIVSGPLAGITGSLASIRGKRHKRLLVQIEGLLAASVEVTPEIIKYEKP